MITFEPVIKLLSYLRLFLATSIGFLEKMDSLLGSNLLSNVHDILCYSYHFLDGQIMRVYPRYHLLEVYTGNNPNVPPIFRSIALTDAHPYIEYQEIPGFILALKSYPEVRRNALAIILFPAILASIESAVENRLLCIIILAIQYGENAHHFLAIILELLVMFNISPSAEEWDFVYFDRVISVNYMDNLRQNLTVNFPGRSNAFLFC